MASSSSSARFIDSPVAQAGEGAPSRHNVIAHAIEKARSQGLDEIQQYHSAVRAVMRVEPDLPLLVAARLINALLEEQDGRGDLSRYASVVARRPAMSMSDG